MYFCNRMLAAIIMNGQLRLKIHEHPGVKILYLYSPKKIQMNHVVCSNYNGKNTPSFPKYKAYNECLKYRQNYMDWACKCNNISANTFSVCIILLFLTDYKRKS